MQTTSCSSSVLEYQLKRWQLMCWDIHIYEISYMGPQRIRQERGRKNCCFFLQNQVLASPFREYGHAPPGWTHRWMYWPVLSANMSLLRCVSWIRFHIPIYARYRSLVVAGMSSEEIYAAFLLSYTYLCLDWHSSLLGVAGRVGTVSTHADYVTSCVSWASFIRTLACPNKCMMWKQRLLSLLLLWSLWLWYRLKCAFLKIELKFVSGIAFKQAQSQKSIVSDIECISWEGPFPDGGDGF